ncbi:WD repeat-containing protein 74 [Globomyces sp. JEL0801]|nr:WD repeat-containing protein 74 [Globomyces sp. JEL0801]
MRFITGDEVGLIKITTFNNETEPLLANKKLKSKNLNKKPTTNQTKTISLGKVNRNHSIQKLQFTYQNGIVDKNSIVVAKANGHIDLWNLSQSKPINEFHIFEPITNQKTRKNNQFIGLAHIDGLLISSTDNGIVNYTVGIKTMTVSLHQDNLSKMIVHPKFPNIFATGGNERDLCIWDIQSEQEEIKNSSDDKVLLKDLDGNVLKMIKPIWKAKNVRNDKLDMRVNVWITDLQWLNPDNYEELLVATGYHHIRTYNTKLQKRPLTSFTFGEYPIKCIAFLKNDSQSEFLISDTVGNLTSIDSTSGQVVGKYKGIAGAVSGVYACQNSSHVISIGLDRHLRVYEGSAKRRLLQQTYLKQRLSALLVDEDWQPESNVVNEGEDAEADEDVWEGIPEVEDVKETRKRKNKN